jgi:hypothetical protein
MITSSAYSTFFLLVRTLDYGVEMLLASPCALLALWSWHVIGAVNPGLAMILHSRPSNAGHSRQKVREDLRTQHSMDAYSEAL